MTEFPTCLLLLFYQDPYSLIDEQIIDCEQSAIDQHQDIDYEAESEFGFDCLKQLQKGKDQDQVIRQETEQLPCRVAPTRVEQGMDKVKRIPEKDTAKNDG